MSSIAVFVAGTVSAVVMLLIALAFGEASAGIYASQPEIWKPMTSLWYIGMIFLYLLVGLVYALVYSVLGKGIKGRAVDKGLLFGALAWFIGPLTYVLLIHLTMAIDTAMIIMWLLQGLLNSLAGGVSAAVVFEMLHRGNGNGDKNLRSGRKRAR